MALGGIRTGYGAEVDFHRRYVLILAMGLALALAAQACVSQSEVDPLERQAQALDKTIMCPVCPGQSIDQSQVQIAKDMRTIVREKLAEGWTDEQVKAFFVERYGPSVLMEPPTQGFHLLAWLLPPVGVGATLVGLFLTLRYLRLGGHPSSEPALGEDLSKEERQSYQERIEAALAGEVGYITPEASPGTSGSREEERGG